jgi:hypothetical protein
VEHRERFAGESNYTFGKSLHIWSRLAYSYSVKPLKLVTILGSFAFIFGSLGRDLAKLPLLRLPERPVPIIST